MKSDQYACLFILLITLFVISCEEEKAPQPETIQSETIQPISNQPYFIGTVLGKELNTLEEEDWSSSRYVDRIRYDSSLIINQVYTFFIYQDSTEQEGNTFYIYKRNWGFTLRYYIPMVEEIPDDLANYLTPGSIAFLDKQQGGLDLTYEKGAPDGKNDDGSTIYTNYPYSTMAGTQSESTLNLLNIQPYNLDSYSVLLEIDARLYDQEGQFVGNIEGQIHALLPKSE